MTKSRVRIKFEIFELQNVKTEIDKTELMKIVVTCNNISFYYVNFPLKLFGCLLYLIHSKCFENTWLPYVCVHFLKVYKARFKTKNI